MICKIPTARRLAGCATALLLAAICLTLGCEFGMEATGPECSLSPGSLVFGNVAVGSSSSLSFSIENVGTETLTGYVTEDASDFGVTSGGGTFSVAPGASHSVTVRFSPAVRGDSSCNVQLGNTRCTSIRCTGTGTGPVCDVDPTEIDFGTVPVGSFLDRTFNIRNVGEGTLTGDVSESYPHFSIVGGEGYFSLILGQTHTVTVRFEPATTGEKSGAVTTGVNCSAVSLEGVGGEGPECQVTPGELSFGNVAIGSEAFRMFEIENVGAGILSGYVSASCSVYTVTEGMGAFSLEAGEVHGVTVRFVPTSEGLATCDIAIGTEYCSDVHCSGNGYVTWK